MGCSHLGREFETDFITVLYPQLNIFLLYVETVESQIVFPGQWLQILDLYEFLLASWSE